ncbi:SGNH/GDSL hydrolase family protein [Nonomuraea gerenzanensis]|uniref:Secreted protein, putative n=1 Tax=Nonomuraea gerenzanensis TaxID=93944 RepID=A0A1M4EIF3_9ACTN|nr:SGNH/GDSL hydrolase family protein [Nonomuraea gerenzanensis]UBU10203.1 SGNH/GDSL hydrolase family protein [Nonomuraea gerenzanensis]SBO98580.1 secreted protein, putative [Nonomuraea gerenzanensis]
MPVSPPSSTPIGRWVTTWTAMPQLTEPDNMPPPPYTKEGLVLADTTLRQTLRVTLGGRRLRLRLSNAFGDVPLPITRMAVALPRDGAAGVSGIRPETSRPVTFSGRAATVVPAGAHVVSDPLELDVAPGTVLTVTVHLADGLTSSALTSHPGSRTTSHLATGDHVHAADLPAATPVDHWYLLSGAEVWAEPGAATLVLLGDSLTDGRGSTTNGNDRWPDRLFDRLPPGIAVANQGAGGNRVLNDGLGPSALARLDRDVLAQSAVRWLLVFEGVNDLGTAPATPAGQREVVERLLAGYEQIAVRARARDLVVYGATLTPFGGNDPYDDPEGHREAARQAVNAWIRESGTYDAVIDFDRAVRDPAAPRRLAGAYDEGDHLHLSPAGYRVLAEAVPLTLFG